MMLMFIQSISNEIVPMQCTFNYRMSAGALKTDSRFTVNCNRTVPSVVLYYYIAQNWQSLSEKRLMRLNETKRWNILVCTLLYITSLNDCMQCKAETALLCFALAWVFHWLNQNTHWCWWWWQPFENGTNRRSNR